MIAHHIGYRLIGSGTGWVKRPLTLSFATAYHLSDKAVHLTTIDIAGGIGLSMWPAEILISRVMIGFDTLVSLRVRYTHGWYSIFHGNTIGSGVGDTLGYVRQILLDNDVIMIYIVGSDV